MINYVIQFAVLLIALQAAEYMHIGCYKDTNDRALRYGPQDYGYTIASCSTACLDYKYFSLQAGSWCFCDNDFDHAKKYGAAPAGTCPTNQLGGTWANDIFHHYKYIGCYKDTNDRALRFGPQQPNYNIVTCSNACAGFRYFSLQAGSWCFCDNDLVHAKKYGEAPAGTCPTSRIGGQWGNDIFQNSNGWIVFLKSASVTDEDSFWDGDSDVYIDIRGTYCENVSNRYECNFSDNKKTQVITTPTIQGNNNPVWNIQYDFGDSSRYYIEFDFDVYDEDSGLNNDDNIGWMWREVGYSNEHGNYCTGVANCKCGLQAQGTHVRNGAASGTVYVEINNPLMRPLCD